ncbi:hypothetical protein ABI59_13440 [Acidobacteria bacterium Mor1]|nr:hypothetical protein ABI59_13440 [Acidobacteria bacterium Mor1]
MSATISVYGFETSNNMKVRIALGYKGIDYAYTEVDPGDRAELLRLTGQFLTPVMVHGERTLFDSAAILRYLDANFLETPRLFGGSVAEQWEIEDWELFARHTLAAPLMELVHTQKTGGAVDDAMRQRCAAGFAQATSTLIEALQGREWLVGDSMTAADIHAGAVMHRVKLAGLFPFPPEFETIEGWVGRVMAFDRMTR